MAWTHAETTEFLRRVQAADAKFKEASSSLKNLLACLRQAVNPPAGTVRQEVERIPQKKRDKYQNAIHYLYKNYPDLDKRVEGFTFIGFDRIRNSQARLDRAKSGFALVYRLILRVQEKLNYVLANVLTAKAPANWNEQERKSTELFQKWFDRNRGQKSLDKVKGVIGQMRDALQQQGFEIVVYGTPEAHDLDGRGWGAQCDDSFAFVIKAENAYRIYLARLFFQQEDLRVDVARPLHAEVAQTPEEWQKEKQLKEALDAAIITSLHELTHITLIAPDIIDVIPNPYDRNACLDRAKNHPDLALTNAENYALFAKDVFFAERFF